MSKTFEVAYFVDENREISIQAVANQIENNRDTLARYKGNLFCPECRKARLSFVSKTNNRVAHFRMTQNQQHKDGCSYIHEYATKDIVTEYVKDLTEKQIENKLNAIMNMLCKSDARAVNQSVNSEKNKNNPMVIHISQNNTNHSLRRKSLSGWLDVDEKQLYVFYGKVKLAFEKKNGKCGDFYILHIKTKNSNNEWKNKVNLTSSRIFENINENSIYRIAMIGSLNKKYMKISLLKNSIIYEVIQE
ncbi:hypothetical protein NYR61_10925 [Actinobacillus genomosp. 1]|uniref:hypothetical protein n=1 Tax=Actinobacillus genomosp. 1 TaxID=254839 RepID=UPI0024413DF4|nr:hypothetical protein [Actinobacillus genomosp. 1]WGE33961.1 hypothetical protein NYR61_10925 [Actinobacillus genomosp. 1]